MAAMSVQTTKLAERLAALASIDIGRIASTGAVKARDVAALLPMPPNVVAFASARSATLPGTRHERAAFAKREIPHFYQTIDVVLDRLSAFADGLGEPKPSLLDIVVLATARLLRRTPALNAAWQDEGMLLYDRIDIALSQGSRMIVIADADRTGLRGINQSIAAAEEGLGTFAIADFTAAGIREASAIIDPHHAGVIALGAPHERAVMKDGAVAVETYCRVTLSADHRVVDGAAAAEFLSELKTLLEDPISLLL
jgi:pyruvate dehydrogenase E2 component (dihydrolipoamide acetyltransferase)